MRKYYTKWFNFSNLEDIDKWLESMTRVELTASEGRDPEIEGYVVVSGTIVITISRWEMK